MSSIRILAATSLALLLLVSCGDDEEAPETTTAADPSEAPEPPAGPLLEQRGALGAGDASDARGRYDRYFVDVEANDRLLVTLRSSAFDPILEVTPPRAGALVNDDWEGDTSHSQIELISPAAGQMKIEVRSYNHEGDGAYSLLVRRVGADGAEESVVVLTEGQTRDGEITGEADDYVIRAQGPVRITVSARGGETPGTSLVGPGGRALSPQNGRYDPLDAGSYRLRVLGAAGLAYRVQVAEGQQSARPLLARAHHRFAQIFNQLAGTGQGASDPTPSPPASSARASAGQVQGQAPAASTLPRALPLRIGDRLNGNLAANDARLPSGEYFDVYELQVSEAGEQIAIEMESEPVDCFLRVDGPNGGHWENDDAGGTLNSRVELTLEHAGTYRVVTTSYRPGEMGPYELKVLTARPAPAPAPGQPVVAREQRRIDGSLAEGDSQLSSGEFFDEHTFEWQAGERVHIEAQSTEFDTYLIVHPPDGGPQQDNDDMTPGESLNAGLDLQVGEAGTWRVVVTSYQPGETGAYTLVLGGAGGGGGVATTAPSNPPGTPAPPGATPQGSPPPPGGAATPSGAAHTETGNLAQGDTTLSSGEFTDTYRMTFTPRSAVQIRLESSDFDTYLIVRSPSGDQDDNDDLTPGQGLNSGLDIPVAEPGEYQIIVTSYRAGETGRYTLTTTEGRSVVSPPVATPSPNTPGAPPGSSAERGHVWGLFAGITDYPGQTNDLPECANDARKLAEAIRNQGNMPPSQEFLLTDSQATRGAIREAMQTIAQRIQPDDVFFFFYSGHGGQTDSSDDPRELDERDEYLFVYDGQLMDDEVGALFDQINARIALVTIDACFSGGFAKDVITRRGRVGMFSSEEDVTSAVAGRFQAGGYLSHFLRLGIHGAADQDPQNSILTVGELTHYTWRQFGQHAADVRMSMGYQHLVVDRGAVPTTDVLWAVQR